MSHSKKKRRTGLFSVTKFADVEAEQALSDEETFDDEYADESTLAQRQQIAIQRRDELGRRKERVDDVVSRWEDYGNRQEEEQERMDAMARRRAAAGQRPRAVATSAAVGSHPPAAALKRKHKEMREEMEAAKRVADEKFKGIAQRQKQREMERKRDRELSRDLRREELRQREQKRLREKMEDERLRQELEDELRQTKRVEMEIASEALRPKRRRETISDVPSALPAVGDPSLFFVPCVKGKERACVMEIYTRFRRYRNNPKKQMFIKAAFTTDQNTGFIYIEADREHHVKAACEGISGLQRWKIKLVPRSEMVQTLTIRTSAPQIRRGQWCRVERPALYKEDLAQVFDVIDNGAKVVLRLEPRLNYAVIAEATVKQRQLEEELKEAQLDGDSSAVDAAKEKLRAAKADTFRSMRMGGMRPDKKLFNPVSVESSTGIRPEQRRLNKGISPLCHYFKGKYFRDGYLLLTMATKNVNLDITASATEVARLRRSRASSERSLDEEMDKAPPPVLETLSEKVSFTRGDHVKVLSGALQTVTGTVVFCKKQMVTIVPDDVGLRVAGKLQVAAHLLAKEYKVGNRVRIVAGGHKDEIGDVVAIIQKGSKSQLVVLSSTGARQLVVAPASVALVTSGCMALPSAGGYELYDLVQLSQDSAAVVVASRSGQLSVLTHRGYVQRVRPQDVVRSLSNKYALALDISQQAIRHGDKVIPQTGAFCEASATVRHIYRSTLFCFSEQCLDNAHMFVTRSRLVRRAGASSMAAAMGATAARAGNCDEALRVLLPSKERRKSRRDPWLMKTVYIKKGPYKGATAIVKKATDSSLRVELSAKAKIVTVTRDMLKLLNADGSVVESAADYNEDAASTWKRQQPVGRRGADAALSDERAMARGIATPAYGVQYGAQTPAYESTTATPAYGGRTPAYGGLTPAYGGLTPAYGGATPAYGGHTPAYGYDAAIGDEDDISETLPYAFIVPTAHVIVGGQLMVVVETDGHSQTAQLRATDGSLQTHAFDQCKRSDVAEGNVLLAIHGPNKGKRVICQALDFPSLCVDCGGNPHMEHFSHFVKIADA